MYASLQAIYPGALADTLQFDLGMDSDTFYLPNLDHIGDTVAGRAFPCRGRQVYESRLDRLRIEMLQDVPEVPWVQVVSSGSNPEPEVAIYGDISAKLAGQAGAVGALLDGKIRDLSMILANRMVLPRGKFGLGFRGVSPLDAYGQWEIYIAGSCHVNIRRGTKRRTFGSDPMITVHPTSAVYVSKEGTMIFPEAELERVVEHAEARMDNEADVRELIARGVDPLEIYDTKGRW